MGGGARMSLVAWKPAYRMFARLHGMHDDEEAETGKRDFASVYADYAESAAKASLALQRHGRGSMEFKAADTQSMRLFHRVKKMQGLKRPGRETSARE